MAAKRWSHLIQYSWHPNSRIFPSLQLAQLSSHRSALQRLTVCPSQVKQQRTEQSVLIEAHQQGWEMGGKLTSKV